MTRLGITLSVGLVALSASTLAAASRDDDDFIVTGIMLAAAEARGTAVPLRERIFYWLDEDESEGLAKHRGQRVEIRGELEDFEKGKVDVDRHDDYTKVKIRLDGKTEEAKVPSSWLNEWANAKDQKFEIVARRIDVKKIKVLGACGS